MGAILLPDLSRPMTPLNQYDNSPQQAIDRWFEDQGWSPFAFQQETWRLYLNGESGVVHAPTGTGKTLSVWLGPVMEALIENSAPVDTHEPIRVLWITPLRALANDTLESLGKPITALGLPWYLQKRTGDSSASVREKMKTRFPTALVTTPESLSLLLSYPKTRRKLKSLRCVVVDEWHELLSTKRGVQTELCLARLRKWLPQLRTWGLSATLGNIDKAMAALLGPDKEGHLIEGEQPSDLRIDTLIPSKMERFPWAGHIGIKMAPEVAKQLDHGETTLFFTNTRSQAEMWYQRLIEIRPELYESSALHHGSLDRSVRLDVEEGLRTGRLKFVVATSSLDLGVDFSPVDQVIQLGSPKGIARLLQRAGRSGHRPGAVSRILCVPTNAFELVEFSAARTSAERREIEPRPPMEKPLDVLAQHLVTLSSGAPFAADGVLKEVRGTFAYRNLTDEEWQWTLDFLSRGGPALDAYPEYSRLGFKNNEWRPTTSRIVKQHRMTIGTITSDASISIKFKRGRSIGSLEEWYISKLKPGDCFTFAGKVLELVRLDGLSAEVKLAKGKPSTVPRWMGGRMPLSTLLGKKVRERLDEFRQGIYTDREMEAARDFLDLQRSLSIIPKPSELLIERAQTKEGYHLFIYPFEGRLVHEGLSTLAAYRIAQMKPASITTTCNDYGFELVSRKNLSLSLLDIREIFSPKNLLADLLKCLNSTEMARRQFRDIARVAGLLFSGYPGDKRTARHLTVSSNLLYDVFSRFDPENMLLHQARREVLENQLEFTRLSRVVNRLESLEFRDMKLDRLSPLAFQLWAESLREHILSTEKWLDRVEDMLSQVKQDATSHNQ